MLPGLIAPLQGGVRASVPSLVMQSGAFNKFLLLLLVVLSVATWAILVERWRSLAAAQVADRRFRTAFRGATSLAETRLLASQHPMSLQARLAQEGLSHLAPRGEAADLSTESLDLAARAMERARSEELDRLEKNVGFLATVGSVAPFVGLMGTVWGVMSAFLNIGMQGSARLVVVAPGIAEALIATVAGLAAAIPAVVGYNHPRRPAALAGQRRVHLRLRVHRLRRARGTRAQAARRRGRRAAEPSSAPLFEAAPR